MKSLPGRSMHCREARNSAVQTKSNLVDFQVLIEEEFKRGDEVCASTIDCLFHGAHWMGKRCSSQPIEN